MIDAIVFFFVGFLCGMIYSAWAIVLQEGKKQEEYETKNRISKRC